MAILVDYSCNSCGRSAEYWCQQPIASTQTCRCGGTAVRRYGLALLGTHSSPPTTGTGDQHEHHDDAMLGTCTLTPTASRMFSAQARGDTRAVEREVAHQETAIRNGSLDPARPPQSDYPGQR